MTPLRKALVRRAREIIGDPTRWTQSTAARDEQSRAVNPRSPEATQFCGFGALTKAAHEHGLSDRWLIEIFNALALTQVIHANDRHGHTAVLACLELLENAA
jgi:hypothetical protein